MNLTAKAPQNIGLLGGRLFPLPETPNGVSTEAIRESQRMDPISFSCDSEKVVTTIADVLRDTPRVKIIAQRENYLYAEARTFLFRFVDDVEFRIDAEQKLIHFRSASRIGYSDLGTNRRRMQHFRERIEKKLDE